MDEVDYVVVGGGSAGCILAARLTASGRHRVALLESGGEPRSPWIHLPVGFGPLLRSPRYNWGYTSEPGSSPGHRPIPLPSGRGLGGSGLINGMVYVRGQAEDYDGWARGGATGWAWCDVEPVFRRIERYAGGGDARGHDGPIHLTQVRERFPIGEAFLEAASQDGAEVCDDYNAGAQRGYGYYQVNQRDGRRWSPYDAYLRPARRRSNLTVLTGAHVLGLTLDGSRCTGVRYHRDGREHALAARREVIVAAGAIRTPQVLELSGIGDPDVLAGLGLPVRHALPGVGEGYQDHYAIRMNWRLRGVRTLNESSRGWRLAPALVRYLTRHRGILTLGPALCHGFVTALPGGTRPDAQFFFMHASYANAAERVLDRLPGMTIGVIQQRPESLGSIHAGDTDARTPPVIRPSFLSADADRRCLVAAMRIARRVVAQPALAEFVVTEMNPGPDAVTDEDLLAFCTATGQTLYHPCGTCRMGSGPGAVVDTRLRLHGIAGLRVVDASVMPAITSGNIHAPVMMVAERGADMILQDADAQP